MGAKGECEAAQEELMQLKAQVLEAEQHVKMARTQELSTQLRDSKRNKVQLLQRRNEELDRRLEEVHRLLAEAMDRRDAVGHRLLAYAEKTAQREALQLCRPRAAKIPAYLKRS